MIRSCRKDSGSGSGDGGGATVGAGPGEDNGPSAGNTKAALAVVVRDDAGVGERLAGGNVDRARSVEADASVGIECHRRANCEYPCEDAAVAQQNVGWRRGNR